HWKGGPLLRDRDSDCDKPENWAKQAAASTRTERRYYASDFRGNVVAMVTDTGALAEQYRYSATAVPFGIPLGDVTADGTVNATDSSEIVKLYTPNYHVRGDLDLDGDVDSSDLAIVSPRLGDAAGRGVLSVAGVANQQGTTGAEWNQAVTLYMIDAVPYASSIRVSLVMPPISPFFIRYLPCLQQPNYSDCFSCCKKRYGFDDDDFCWNMCLASHPHFEPGTLETTSLCCERTCARPDPNGLTPAGRNVCCNEQVIACTCTNEPLQYPNSPGLPDADADFRRQFFRCIAIFELWTVPANSCVGRGNGEDPIEPSPVTDREGACRLYKAKCGAARQAVMCISSITCPIAENGLFTDCQKWKTAEEKRAREGEKWWCDRARDCK
ncbi:MAG: dockerin type I domain-containing protein, partial [Phycisphaerales bacterium]